MFRSPPARSAFAIGLCAFALGSRLAAAADELATTIPKARTDAGWVLNGAKIWTTFAHHAQYMIGLFRTAGTPADKQKGLSH